MATTASAVAECSNRGEQRATMNTPAVTMVAAVDERRDGGRPFHRVGQPGVSRNSCADLSHRADEEEKADQCKRVALEAQEAEGVASVGGGGAAEHGRIVDRVEHQIDGEDAESEAEISHTVDDEPP